MAQAATLERAHNSANDIDIHMIDVDGQMLRVAIKDGPDTAPPLLMFNGIGANLELAFPFLDQIEGRKGIIFDVPGIGGSPLPALPYRPGTLARWAKRLCDTLGHDEVDVSGVSWGGGMAQQFVYQYPSLTRKLVLCATSAGWIMQPGKPNVLSKMASPKRYTEPGYMRAIAAEIYGGAFRRDPNLIVQHASAMKATSNAGYSMQLLAMVGWTSVGWLWRFRQSTLIISGTDDPLIPVNNARLLNTLIPKSRLELVDDGHLFMVTDPVGTAQLVEAFLNEGEA
ncbi:MAG: poly(3-hydroxyalkanoate) depolymerase [Pseudomonadota bacterium]